MMEAAVAAAEISGHRMFRPFQLACIGTACARLGNAGRGLDKLDEAASMAADGERQYVATIHRHRGEILQGLGRRRDAVTAFEAALSVARRQGHRIEELRVAAAMVRYAATPDEAQAARKVLKEIYATFEEGHAFPDLQAARDLLEA